MQVPACLWDTLYILMFFFALRIWYFLCMQNPILTPFRRKVNTVDRQRRETNDVLNSLERRRILLYATGLVIAWHILFLLFRDIYDTCIVLLRLDLLHCHIIRLIWFMRYLKSKCPSSVSWFKRNHQVLHIFGNLINRRKDLGEDFDSHLF